ncbi:MAG: methyltransferase domain-containing protein [Chloroflexi bacterium]|nr:methyltransferase domain-containing protein [Chloroflexota bacterium]
MNSYTERDTEAYYDNQDAIYSSFWDPDGSVHWGYFDEHTGNDFLKACSNLNRIMAEKAQITRDSRVLDLGCGNGTTSLRLHEELGCEVVGIDLSGVRIDNAREALREQSPDVQARVSFEKASATSLPFEDGFFTHVWSQATLYHVHDQEAALREAYRVLCNCGVFVFDDLFKPVPTVSDNARKHVYERLLFDTDYNFETYQKALEAVGFTVRDTEDLSPHLKMSYWCLATMTHNKSGEHAEHYRELSHSYEQTALACSNREVGWGLFNCQKQVNSSD